MKETALIIALSWFSSSALAQTTAVDATGRKHELVVVTELAVPQIVTSKAQAASPWLAAPPTVHLAYYDMQKPSGAWAVPVNYGQFQTMGLAQRFTLPTTSGYLDSITIFLDTIVGSEIGVLIARDTLFETAPGEYFHLIDIFSDRQPYAEQTIVASALPVDGSVTLRFDHLQVDKNFFVLVVPKIENNTFVSGFGLRMEIEPVRERNTENSRSAMLAQLPGGQILSSIFDGVFQIAGADSLLYGQFYIDAFVDTTQPLKHVAMNGQLSELQLYPNPVRSGEALTFGKRTEPVSKVQIYDLLGREVHSSVDLNEISTNGLTPGSYIVVVTLDGQRHEAKLVVAP